MNKIQHIFSDNIEQGALDQFESAMEQDFSVRGALMPDAHQGYDLPIGGVVATEGMIMPAWVGYDIGCGMCAIPTHLSKAEAMARAGEIFKAVYDVVPVGFNHNKEINHEAPHFGHCTSDLKAIFEKFKGGKQLGTLGGGNHFIEIGYDLDDVVWIIIHSGSRGFGWQVASHHMKVASAASSNQIHAGFRTESDQGQAYITDMEYCMDYALLNRQLMIASVMKVLGTHANGDLINRNHNHATFRDGMWIHRKGATHAEDGMMGVIPGNMRDGSFIVRGLGNAKSLWSSSHGAGRVLGRKAAKRSLDVKVFEAGMEGITANVSKGTLDESPEAYKNIFDVMDLQRTLVEVVNYVRPIINVKG